jgi:hypothetical protein
MFACQGFDICAGLCPCFAGKLSLGKDGQCLGHCTAPHTRSEGRAMVLPSPLGLVYQTSCPSLHRCRMHPCNDLNASSKQWQSLFCQKYKTVCQVVVLAAAVRARTIADCNGAPKCRPGCKHEWRTKNCTSRTLQGNEVHVLSALERLMAAACRSTVHWIY